MKASTRPNYYEILQLQPFANPALVIAAYRILSKLYHPDTAKEEADLEKFRLLQEAYDVLNDPQKRRDYDSELRLNAAATADARPDTTTSDFQRYGYRPEPTQRDPLWESKANRSIPPPRKNSNSTRVCTNRPRKGCAARPWP